MTTVGVNRIRLLFAAQAAFVLSCSQESSPAEHYEQSAAALTESQQRVLGFESPTQDWSATVATVGQSATVTQGSKSLSIAPSYWTEVTSVPLASLGQTNGALSFDVRAPAGVPWGQVRAVLFIPSQNYFADVGGVEISSLPAGNYHTVQFDLDAEDVTALSGTYSDLRVRVIVNAPPGGGAFLFDNLRLTDTDPDPGDGDGATFSIAIPQGKELDDLLLSATQFVKIDSRVELSNPGELTTIASAGDAGIEFESGVLAHANLESEGHVKLASQSVVDGVVTSEIAPQLQDGSVQLPPERIQVVGDVQFYTYGWDVELPSNAIELDPVTGGETLSLSPGAYTDLNISSGNLVMVPGVYYFDSFISESSTEIHVDLTAGPLVIYVKGNLTYRGPFVLDGGEAGKILIGHLGVTPAIMKAPFVGAIVSPNGGVELQRPDSGQHQGAFFGKTVQIHSDAHVLPKPFDFDGLFAPDPADVVPDTDGDGWDDLSEICILDPLKQDPGICDCGFSDLADDDSDEVPNCVDQCPLDPNNSEPGACGCQGEAHLQLAGTPCFSPSGTKGTCDGAGRCSADPLPPVTTSEGGGCRSLTFRGHFYWFCDGAYTWAEAESRCTNAPYRYLAKIDDRKENLWAAAVSGGNAWIGANDIDAEGEWFWSSPTNQQGLPFWTGEADGARVARRFARWADGAPSTGDCGAIQANARWSDETCTEDRGFICEQPIRHWGTGGGEPPSKPLDPRDAYPSIPDDAIPPPDGTEPPGAVAEAEDGETPEGPVDLVTDGNASGDTGIVFTDDSIANPNGTDQRLIYTFNVSGGTYRIWLRLIAPSFNDDSFWASVDGAPFFVANNYAVKTGWTWDELHNSNSGGAIVEYDWAPGIHTLEIRARESGLRIDQVYATSLGDTPSGIVEPPPAQEYTCVEYTGFPGDPDPYPYDPDGPIETKFNASVSSKDECDTACETFGSASTECDTACNDGSFTNVPAADGICTDFTSYERGFCSIVSWQPDSDIDFSQCEGGDCCGSNAECPTAYPQCGRRSVCAVLENTDACDELADCGTGYRCFNQRCVEDCSGGNSCSGGSQCEPEHEVCVDAAKTDPCQDSVPGSDGIPICVGICFSSNRCGVPDPDCAVNDDFSDFCETVEMCHPRAIVVEPALSDDSNVDNSVFPDEEVFDPPPEPPLSFPLAKPEGCGGEYEPECEFPIGEHPWCKLALNDYLDGSAGSSTLAAAAVGGEVSGSTLGGFVSDADHLGDKVGRAGKGEAISFDFDPNLVMDYNINALPFGDSRFDAQAAAGVSAGVSFNLFDLYEGRVSILDAYGDLLVDRCGFDADARFALLGIDFLPALLGDSYEELQQLNTPEDLRTACNEAITAYEGAVDRAQKAMRDAQELLRQYRELVASGMRFNDNLCEELLLSGAVPDRFFEKVLPSRSCEGINPERAINLMIKYYRHEVIALVQQQAAMLGVKAAELVPSVAGEQLELPELPEDFPLDLPDNLELPKWEFSIPFLQDVSEYSSFEEVLEANVESQQVANINFAIGPVPMNLTVDVFYSYGVGGSLDFQFSPGNLLVAYRTPDENQSLARVQANVTPFAGAGVTLFLGAGFSFGPLEAKLGIAGNVSLGIISLPISAGAGIEVATESDERTLPADLSAIASDGPPMFPPGGPVPQRFKFSAGYQLGATLNVSHILAGNIDARLRIKFFFFSKTWKVRIISFGGLGTLSQELISVGSGFDFEFDTGPLGGFQMPVPFVDLVELDENPPPLPPLPDPEHPVPPGGGPSLGLLGGTADDPRYVGFDAARVEKLFFEGYCEPLECAPSTVFPSGLGDNPNPADYYIPENQCEDISECCDQGTAEKPAYCWPIMTSDWENGAYCQPCREKNERVVLVGEGPNTCCPDAPYNYYHPEVPDIPGSEGYRCSGDCRDTGDYCWVGDSYWGCCDENAICDPLAFGSEAGKCVVKQCIDTGDYCQVGSDSHDCCDVDAYCQPVGTDSDYGTCVEVVIQ